LNGNPQKQLEELKTKHKDKLAVAKEEG